MIKAKAITGKKVIANWYNPRTGKATRIGVFNNDRQLVFTPPLPAASPVPSQREDWVLVLDDAAKNYPMPL